jgi:translocating chain-associated membrane protein 1
MAIKGKRGPGSNTKKVSYLSHEFIIQNHGDIATCVCMFFVIGFMFQITTPFASSFAIPQYNVTNISTTAGGSPTLYTYGLKDVCLIFFYTICAVIFHAIIQEYVLDKYIRRVKLSKTKSNKFNESGQMLAFYLVSIVWGLNIFKNVNFFFGLRLWF